jgi:hypothetical protein
MITSVPKLWPGDTFALLGSGPSLAPADVDAVRGRARVIAINNGYQLAPWADVLYAADAKWIDWHDGVPGFQGPKYSIEGGYVPATTRPQWQVLRNTGFVGLELDPSGLRMGYNSGYQSINLAVHLGAARILLLGYDLSPAPDGRTHWFGDHPDRQPSPYAAMLDAFPSLVEPLAAIGVTVINCSRRTVLQTFPCAPLEDELARLERAA